MRQRAFIIYEAPAHKFSLLGWMALTGMVLYLQS